jgi:hypothetical protein
MTNLSVATQRVNNYPSSQKKLRSVVDTMSVTSYLGFRKREHIMYRYNYEIDENDDTNEIEHVTAEKFVIARVARGRILPGDLLKVVSGFKYTSGGPRTGYFRRTYLVGYGPGHGSDQMGRGNWWPKGGFRAVHPTWADQVELRDSREATEGEARRAAEKAAWELARQKARDVHYAIIAAKTGSTVTFRGQSWVTGPEYTKLIVHSTLEYYGQPADCSARGARRLTNEQGEEVEYLF